MEELRSGINELSLNNKKRYWEMIWKAEEERRSRWINDESFREKEMARKAEEEEEKRIDVLKRCGELDEIKKMEKIDKERYEEMMKETSARYFFDFYRGCHLIEYPPITHHISASPLEIINNSQVNSINEIRVGVIIHVRHTIQYWCPGRSTSPPGDQSSAAEAASACVCSSTHHDAHDDDDDDDDLQLITSHLLGFNPPEIYNLWLDFVFNSENDAEIMFSIYNQLYLKCSTILSSYKQLEEVMKSISDSISEKKEYVLKERPRHLDISVLIYFFEHKYFQYAEDAYPAFASAGHPDNPDFIEFIDMHNERRRNAASCLPNDDPSRGSSNISSPILFINY